LRTLRKRLLFTFALLAVYRLGIFHHHAASTGGDAGLHQPVRGLLSLLNLFSGGAPSSCPSSRSHHAVHQLEHHPAAAHGGHPALEKLHEGG
jgi:hypothetical protein